MNCNQPVSPTRIEIITEPLTKREYFAAMAMQGFIARGENVGIYPELFAKEIGLSVNLADLLINELNKQP